MKHVPFNTTSLNPFNIDFTSGNWIAGFSDTSSKYGTFPEAGWQNIIQFDTFHFVSQISITAHVLNEIPATIHIRKKYDSSSRNEWSKWVKITTSIL